MPPQQYILQIMEDQEENPQPVQKKRGRKKGKGRELQDLLSQSQSVLKVPNTINDSTSSSNNR